MEKIPWEAWTHRKDRRIALITSFISNYATTYDVVYESPSATDDPEQPTKASDS